MPIKKIITTTTESIPGKEYEIIGVISSDSLSVSSKLMIQHKGLDNNNLEKLKQVAQDLGADAVVGIRISHDYGRETYIGTAVKFKWNYKKITEEIKDNKKECK